MIVFVLELMVVGGMYDFIHQGDTERLAKFKIRIEDPPRRKDMVRPLSTSLNSIHVASYCIVIEIFVSSHEGIPKLHGHC